MHEAGQSLTVLSAHRGFSENFFAIDRQALLS
jgi:hypothetical protein